MDREKLVGEKFREGRMEVAFELWIEQVYFYSFSRLQRRFPPLPREAISELKINSRIVLSAEVFLNLGGTTDMYVRPGRLAQGVFLSVLDNLYIQEESVMEKKYDFPAVFMPCRIKDYAFMDGGVLDNVPVQEVRNQGAERVLAVKFDADQIEKDSNIMDIAMKTIDIMGSKISEEGLKTSDYILNVYTDKVGLLDIEKLDKCYEYGYQSVIKNLDAIKKALG